MSEETKQNQEFGCSRWLRFLNQSIVNQAAIDYLQEFFGYCLTTDVIFPKALVLVGSGGCGKSLVLEVLREIVKPAPVTNLTIEEINDQSFRRFLQPSVLNISVEDDIRAVLKSVYFKSILAGDTINASYLIELFQKPRTFAFRPFCKLAIETNHLPPELLRSQAAMRRLLVVLFKKIPPEAHMDGLFDLFKQEIQGIRFWAESGLKRLLERGGTFTDPCPVCAGELDALEQGGVAVLPTSIMQQEIKIQVLESNNIMLEHRPQGYSFSVYSVKSVRGCLNALENLLNGYLPDPNDLYLKNLRTVVHCSSGRPPRPVD